MNRKTALNLHFKLVSRPQKVISSEKLRIFHLVEAQDEDWKEDKTRLVFS